MGQNIIREYVTNKKRTVWGTFILLVMAAIEYYYINCSLIYMFGYCELTYVFILLAVLVAAIGLYFGKEEME